MFVKDRKAGLDQLGACPFEACKAPMGVVAPCADCGSPTNVHQIGLDLDEVAYLRNVIGTAPEKLKHSLLICPNCHIAGFPCTSSEFTVRTDDAPFKAGGRSMPIESWVSVTIHHADCTSTSLQTLPVTFTKDTIKTIMRYHTPTLDAWMHAHPDRRMHEFMVPRPSARPRSRKVAPGTTPNKSVAKSAGLRVLKSLAQRASSFGAARWSTVLARVVDALRSTAPSSLFLEWSPTGQAPTMRELTMKDVISSHNLEDANKALAGTSGSWIATTSSLLTWWACRLVDGHAPAGGTPADAASGSALPTTVRVSRVEITWDASSGTKLIPRRCVVELCPDELEWTPAAAPAQTQLKQVFNFDPPVDAVMLRVSMRGWAVGNTSRLHGIASIRAFHSVHAAVDTVSPTDTLHSIQQLLSVSPVAAPSTQSLSLCGLVLLVQASGSLSQLTRLLSVLWEGGDEAIDPQSEVAASLSSLLDVVHGAATSERNARIAAEAYCPATPSAASSSLSSIPARFDADKSYLPGSQGVVEIREGDMVAASVSGSHSVVLFNRCFTAGKANWEIRLEEDTSSQCTCFGVATKPIRDCNYEKSKEMWLYRAYNGYKYTQGVCSSAAGPKINKGDVVRCELDMDAGTLQLFVNGAVAGSFTGLQGLEIWPAVQFYSSGRVVRLLSCEASGGVASTACETRLCTLDESESQVGYGVLGKGGDLGFPATPSRKVVVGGVSSQTSLSMHPPANHDGKSFASVKYALTGKYERLYGSVALCDSVPLDKLRQQGSPMTFTIWADGSLKWSSPAVFGTGVQNSFEVSLLEVQQLELRVQVDNKNKYCHAIWVDPVLVDCVDWSCVGWRNDKASFVCEVSGTKRGQNPAFEHESELVGWSFAGVSDALLQRLGALATQYSRGIKAGAGLSEFGESLVDLESPYCIEVGAEPLLALAAGLEKAAKLSQGPARDYGNRAYLNLLRLIRANLVRLLASRVDSRQVFATSPSVLDTLFALLSADWTSCSSEVDECSKEVISCCWELFHPSIVSMVRALRQAVPLEGVMELQLAFPSAASIGDDGESVSLDTVVLRLQLLARDRGWRHAVVGRWPAKLYAIVEVGPDEGSASGGLLDFLELEWPSLLESCGFSSWSFPDGITKPFIPVKFEHNPAFNRPERLLLETESILRLYSHGTFDQVVSGVKAFLPK